MTRNLRPTVQQIIEQLATESGILRPNLVVSSAAQNGESFSGSVLRILVGDSSDDQTDGAISNSPARPNLRFIAKQAPVDPQRRYAFNSARHFKREKYMLDRLMPAFADFQSTALANQLVRPFDSYPKLLAASDDEGHEYVVLNDLQACGYQTATRNQPLPYDRVLLVIKRLAHFHAISIAYKHRDPHGFAALVEPLDEIIFARDAMRPKMRDFMEPNVQFVLDALQLELTTNGRSFDCMIETRQLIDKLRRFRHVYIESMVRCCESARRSSSPADVGLSSDGDGDGEHIDDAVVLHGDCWISNLMFRAAEEADGSGEEDVQFVDWQVARYGSVAIDLSHFLFCCTDGRLRQRLPELLTIYHDNVVQRVGQLGGGDGNVLFPFERLQSHMRRYARFGMGMAIMTLHAVTCPAEEMANVEESLDATGTDRETLGRTSAQMATNPVYRKRIADVCRDADRLGYF